MITEQGAIKVTTRLDGNMQKEISGSLFRLSLAFIIVGAVVFLICLITDLFSEQVEITFDWLYGLSVFLLVIGIFFMMIQQKAVKFASTHDRTLTCEFFSDHIMLNETLNGEIVLTAKTYNNQITQLRETKNYIVLVSDRGTYPLLKSELTPLEQNTIKGMFGKKAVGEKAALPSAPSQPEVKEEVKSDEPFDELKG